MKDPLSISADQLAAFICRLVFISIPKWILIMVFISIPMWILSPIFWILGFVLYSLGMKSLAKPTE